MDEDIDKLIEDIQIPLIKDMAQKAREVPEEHRIPKQNQIEEYLGGEDQIQILRDRVELLQTYNDEMWEAIFELSKVAKVQMETRDARLSIAVGALEEIAKEAKIGKQYFTPEVGRDRCFNIHRIATQALEEMGEGK